MSVHQGAITSGFRQGLGMRSILDGVTEYKEQQTCLSKSSFSLDFFPLPSEILHLLLYID